jgi:probable phosphoglycerate mutase
MNISSYRYMGKLMNTNYCNVILFRHGQTDWNVKGKLQGHTDEPLNEEGEKQALGLKEKLKGIVPVNVFSSDLSRACKTSAIVLSDRKVEIVKTPALRERYMGAWEGRLTTELKGWFKEKNISTESLSRDEYLSHRWQDDIETYSEVYKRLQNFIKLQASSHIGSTVFMSSHGGVLRSLLYHHLDFHPNLRWQVSNCAYLKLQVNEAGEIFISERYGVKETNDASIPF